MTTSPDRPFATLGLALILSLGGCATPHVQDALVPPAGFAGPHMGADAFVVRDGARLPMTAWLPRGEPEVVIVALHGMNDTRAAFRLAGPWWAEHGMATYAYDQRGFGSAPGRGVWAGPLMQADLRDVVALVRDRHPGAVVAVAGESMGGAVAITAFASDDAPQADRLILLAPAVWGWSSQGVVNRAGLWIAARTLGDRAVEPPDWAVHGILASDNWIELIRNGRDPGSILGARFDTLSGLVDLMEEASRALGRTGRPTLLLYGAHDAVIGRDPMRRALQQAGDAPGLRTGWYDDGWHILNRDLQAEAVFRDVEAWLHDPQAALSSAAGPVPERLSTP
ncbi:lysophospholipase [Rhizobium sp. CRIBSB]|nr:lysophospholipase [Rhizobium sp. CRIBSB]